MLNFMLDLLLPRGYTGACNGVVYLHVVVEPLTVGHLQKFQDEACCPSWCARVHPLDHCIHLLDATDLFTDHPFHEPQPTDPVLVVCHQYVYLSHALAYLGHGDAALSLSILHKAGF
jgi:hypothetical protein